MVASHQLPDASRCVDIFRRPDGSLGFEEFRRDPEDMGAWTPIAFHSSREFTSEAEAIDAAREAIPWLGEIAKP